MTIIAKREDKTIAERQATGREARKLVPRTAHGAWTPAPDRPDPLALLRAQDDDRMADLVPIRWGRMSTSPFAFYRGSAILMAADLAPLPRTCLGVQLCGDAHLSNFGLYGSPERELLFDVNDFDETLPGPFEWDLKRLAASFVLAARNNGLGEDVARETALAAVRSYREHMTAYAEMNELDVWYSHIVADELLDDRCTAARPTRRPSRRPDKQQIDGDKLAEKTLTKARGRDQPAGGRQAHRAGRRLAAHRRPAAARHAHGGALAERSDRRGRSTSTRRPSKPTGASCSSSSSSSTSPARWSAWAASAPAASSCCCTAATSEDPLFLQVKEADGLGARGLPAARAAYASTAQRVVDGQRLMQAASDIFLGWTKGARGTATSTGASCAT